MVDNKKQNISIRMAVSDIKKIKNIAKRLEVRDSAVFRFAICSSLEKLSPLHDEQVHGADLLPVFIEYGAEISQYFQLDSLRLDGIINSGLTDEMNRVVRSDLELFNVAARQEQYLYARLKDLTKNQESPMGPVSLLRKYFYEKYVENGSSSERSTVSGEGHRDVGSYN